MNMPDCASEVLAGGLPLGTTRCFRALADHYDVPQATLQHRARIRRSLRDKAQINLGVTLNHCFMFAIIKGVTSALFLLSTLVRAISVLDPRQDRIQRWPNKSLTPRCCGFGKMIWSVTCIIVHKHTADPSSQPRRMSQRQTPVQEQERCRGLRSICLGIRKVTEEHSRLRM